jgi:hypothetical protein
MSPIDELRETVDRLCENIDKAIASEKIFCHYMSIQFEMCLWEIEKSFNELKEIKKAIGVQYV